MTRYRSVDLLSAAGYVTESNFPLPVEAETNSFTWTGDGSGAGTLEIVGDYQFIANTRNMFQHHPTIRLCESYVGVDSGQLDIGVVDGEG